MIKCKFENGRETSLRHVTVGTIVLNSKNQVLLVKRATNLSRGLRGGKYTLPGGFLERDENAESGALRELYEETGLKGKILFLFHINDSPNRPKEDRQNVDFIFTATASPGSFRSNDEVVSATWFSREDLPPEEEFAFDHRETIELYFEYLNKPFKVPILGRIKL